MLNKFKKDVASQINQKAKQKLSVCLETETKAKVEAMHTHEPIDAVKQLLRIKVQAIDVVIHGVTTNQKNYVASLKTGKKILIAIQTLFQATIDKAQAALEYINRVLSLLLVGTGRVENRT